MSDFTCDTCGIYITPDHGGIICRGCDSFFCCDPWCVGVGITPLLTEDVCFSQEVEKCQLCSEPQNC